MAQLNAQEVDEAKRIQDSIRIAQIRTINFNRLILLLSSKLVFDVDSSFVQDTSKGEHQAHKSAKKHKPRTAVWLSASTPRSRASLQQKVLENTDCLCWIWGG
jgi:hypothetical protein